MKTTAFILLASIALFTATHADARDFGRRTTVQTQNGAVTRTVDGSVTRNAFSRTAATTGPNGKTATASRAIQRTDNGRTSNGTYTGPNSKTVTTSGSVTHADGTRTATRSITLPDGTTKSVTNTTTKN